MYVVVKCEEVRCLHGKENLPKGDLEPVLASKVHKAIRCFPQVKGYWSGRRHWTLLVNIVNQGTSMIFFLLHYLELRYY